jgi:hypothetical protein
LHAAESGSFLAVVIAPRLDGAWRLCGRGMRKRRRRSSW